MSKYTYRLLKPSEQVPISAKIRQVLLAAARKAFQLKDLPNLNLRPAALTPPPLLPCFCLQRSTQTLNPVSYTP